MAANLCFTGMVVAMLNAAFPAIPIPLLIIVALAVGLVLGAINGLLVWKLDIPSIVVTLGTLTIFRGATFVLSGGAWVNADQMSPAFIGFQRAQFLGIPVLSWVAILVIALFYLVMTRTALGRSIYAVGVNPTASVYAGIDVGRTKFIAFCISGLVAGLAGYLWISRYVIASVEVANGYELNIIAACVIGGISIAGGIGSVGGAVLGALFLGIIASALPVVNISPFWQMAISGSAIILAVALNARGERKQGRIILRKAEAA
jgi:rhamnose transport system permease protein